MTYNPDVHHRRSIRLPGFDYAQGGIYFVTICTFQRECVLGEVIDDMMRLNEWGEIAQRGWADVAVHFPSITVDPSVVMPNHTHANILIVNCEPDGDGGRGDHAPTTPPGSRRGVVATPSPPTPPNYILHPTLGQIVAYYKYQTTVAINRLRGMPGVRFWQRNYWEHVIREKHDLYDIENYIVNNPPRWGKDKLHPNAPPNHFNRG